ncbi:MAG: hypothetical protein FWE15_12055 [Actinomycetia bacterium]|nr:hypothetical protein [Actinomycetes bacterium]MCL2730741.1 hypothetical protein [Actinomycetes bacterium]
MLPEIPSMDDPHVRHLRRLFLAVVTGSFLFLIPWIAYLSVSLPSHHEVNQWRLAWVGFDGALIAAIGVTAVCAWRRRQIFIPWAIVTATLLCCDAWFDIVLDWNSDELIGSVITAVVAELPLAFLLLYVARKVLRLTVTIAWEQAGRSGPVPPLSRLSLLVLQEDEEGAPPGGDEEDGTVADRTTDRTAHDPDAGRPATAEGAGGDRRTCREDTDTDREHNDDHRHRPPRRSA